MRQRLPGLLTALSLTTLPLTTLLRTTLLLATLLRLAALLPALLPVRLLVELDGLAALLVVALASPFLARFGLEGVGRGLRRELTHIARLLSVDCH
ncbi:MAG: hypothetical protein AUH81_15025 [Candidatus Rokubacteria bacterium 13_1_40CM_4_69_5]|nr:MAG: hypothetical protein AUH81_15025 [Candidatus Rokubacteria bacterium 13_1_40CM_4_69_5]OLE37528.1 MAG: hypothetical protein AUG00_07920 [Candidatus Rokubacteria bacterium 13_1_20CM_2_70_7]